MYLLQDLRLLVKIKAGIQGSGDPPICMEGREAFGTLGSEAKDLDAVDFEKRTTQSVGERARVGDVKSAITDK